MLFQHRHHLLYIYSKKEEVFTPPPSPLLTSVLLQVVQHDVEVSGSFPVVDRSLYQTCILLNKYYMKRAKRKKSPKVKGTFRVYCTYFPDGRYYIGFSTKTGTAFEKYFGSSKAVLEMVAESADHGLVKETIAEFEKRSHARMQEFLLQWQQREDPNCLNDMINIRLRMSHLTDFEPVKWNPSTLAVESEATL